MPSVVIPAHNEAGGIERCLESVLACEVAGLVVVVIANACADDTASRARRFGAPVMVIEAPQPGKANAINLGERALREAGGDSFPRLFLDADIELAPGTAEKLFAAADTTARVVVSAEPVFDASGSSLLVRLFFMAERYNPYHHTTSPNGSGTYCVSKAGRSSWGEFPLIIADDGFVQSHFSAGERLTVKGARATVRTPRTYRALRRTEARQRAGTQELASLRREVVGRGPRATFKAVASATLRNPLLWPALLVWAATRLLERLESRSVAKRSGTQQWQQDRTSREDP
jgi:glycosyltransferase involved in cell wall biosynthesis